MKKSTYAIAAILSFFLLVPSFGNTVTGRGKGLEAAYLLAERLLPSQHNNIVFARSDADGTGNSYRFKAENGRLFIYGDCINSMAMALGDYLRDFCMITPTWYSRDRIAEPERLPDTNGEITRKSLVPNRFFLNYCTYGYTIGWWQWEQWERLIDWMALNGVTMALANTGQESVWQEVWMEMGMTREQTLEYFPGPSFLSWHRMTNMDGWHGPLPQEWLDAQMNLQKKIVGRELELGISPILGSFTGHVPQALKELYPQADIRQLSNWGHFEKKYNPWYLDPRDPLYKEIQKKYLVHQKKMYGQDIHIYGIDLFNEVDPPVWEADYLGKVAETTYNVLKETDRNAVWLQMGWLFYHKAKNWTPELVKAYISSVPKHRLVMLDYYCDKVELFRKTDSFHGQDFIWSYLGNFGGNTFIAGNLKDVSAKLDAALDNEGCVGVGCTLEALDVNPQMYEYVLSRAWEKRQTDLQWIESLADRHIGRIDSNARSAWRAMYDKVLCIPAGNRSAMITARPSMKGTSKWNRSVSEYSNKDLMGVWRDLLAAKESDSPSHRFDLVNVGRQALDNLFSETYLDFIKAAKEGDKTRMDKDSALMLELLDDIERLTLCDGYFLLGRWIEEARSWGNTAQLKDYFEWDARDLLTCWGFRGGKLNDYANRCWNGLTGTYYKPRWEQFITEVKNGTYNEENFQQWCKDFEWNWISTKGDFPSEAQGDARAVAGELYRKYSEKIILAKVDSVISGMTLREKVAQLFIIRPESSGDWKCGTPDSSCSTCNAPVPGGFCLFAENIVDSVQLVHLVDSIHSLAGRPLVAIDEEGGRVARIANNTSFNVPRFKAMGLLPKNRIGTDESAAGKAGEEIGKYLRRYGIDVDFAPDADVNSNPDNPVIGTRAFSDSPVIAAQCVRDFITGLHSKGVASCIKHFPGHGDTKQDSHLGFASTSKNWKEMLECECIPFTEGIKAGTDFVMVSHITARKVTDGSDSISGLPATLSGTIVNGKLRKELGFEGLIITDGMNMGAITEFYGAGEAAVKAVQAGNDIILLPENYREAFEGVLNAVQRDSTICESRIDSSLRRILNFKFRLADR